MINTMQSYQLNNKFVDVDLAQVQELSAPSREILTALNANLPATFQTTASLTNRIHSMEETQEILKATQDNSTKNKIIALLKVVLVIALIAGGAALCGFGGAPVFGVAFLPGILSSIFCFFDGAEKIQNIEQRLPDYSKPWYFPDHIENGARAILPIFGGAVMPLFEACTREARLQRVLETQQQSIEETLLEYKTQNEQALAFAYQFYNTHFPALSTGLDQEIAKLEAILTAMQQLAKRSETAEHALTARIATHQKAKEELTAVKDFYNQFN